MSVLAISASITLANMEANPKVILDNFIIKHQQVLCIYYLVWFSQYSIETFIDSGSKVNVMQPSFIRKLCFCISKTDIDAQKMDGSKLEIFGMIITSF